MLTLSKSVVFVFLKFEANLLKVTNLEKISFSKVAFSF